jgi:hypothetical protein
MGGQAFWEASTGLQYIDGARLCSLASSIGVILGLSFICFIVGA